MLWFSHDTKGSRQTPDVTAIATQDQARFVTGRWSADGSGLDPRTHASRGSYPV